MSKLISMGDRLGIAASALCLMHCLATPVLLVMLPLTGMVWVGWDSAIHRTLAVIVTVPVLFALIPGYIAHRRSAVLLFGALGLSCFLAAVFVIGPRFGEIAEAALSVCGGTLLITAHYRNRGFCRACAVRKEHGICLHE